MHLPSVSLDPEPVILSLTTEIYNYKCLLVMLQIENGELRSQLAALERFRQAAEALRTPVPVVTYSSNTTSSVRAASA